MSRLFISDIHLFHGLMTHRSHRDMSSIEDMHATIIHRWNTTVKKEDTVYVVGDFSFGKFEDTRDILQKLNGQKILIAGNHDRHSKRKLRRSDFLEMGFKDVMDEDVIKLSYNDHSGSKVVPVHLKHYPYERHWLKATWNSISNFVTRTSEQIKTYHQFYPKWTPMIHIHGHIHGGDLVHDNQINVSWETLGGYPISESQIIKLIRAQEKRSSALKWFERVLGRSIQIRNTK